MNKSFTQNDLLRFYYNETDYGETKAVEKALENDFKLKQQYQTLCQTLDKIDQAYMEPSETTIDIIREHSGHFSSLETS